MKEIKRCFFTLIILFALISNICYSQSPRMKNRFYLGTDNFYFLKGLHMPSNIGWYSELHYNMMSNFCAHLEYQPPEWNGLQFDGGFFEAFANFEPYIDDVINSWNTITYDNSLVSEREKVLRACFGQRSTYKVTNPGTWEHRFPSYGYQDQNVTGIDVRDYAFNGGDSVRYCSSGLNHLQGNVMKTLYQNCEQVNNIALVKLPGGNSSSDRLYSDIKDTSYHIRWYVKPSIRIDSVYAKNHPDDVVCYLNVNSFDGQLLSSFPILCKNFLQIYSGIRYYNGNYLEMFYQQNVLPGQINNTPEAFSVSAWDLIQGHDGDPENSLVDYYIYWPGNVDMYLRYLRVDDSWAHFLFTDTIGNKSQWQFYNKIDSETVRIASEPGFSYFWVDEIPYNSLPCAIEVNRLIKKFSNNYTSFLSFANFDNMRWRAGLRGWYTWDPLQSWETVYFNYLDEVFTKHFVSNILVAELYPFFYNVLYPPNVQHTDEAQYPTTHYFQQANNPNDYDDAIQTNAINPIAFYHKTNIEYAKKYSVPYSVHYQVHSDEKNIDIIPNRVDWGLREPTNEEIRVQSYLNLAYGAKQMYQYTYYSRVQDPNRYTFGMTNLPLDLITYEPSGKRLLNYYGQAKWDSVVVLNQKLRQMGDFLYPVGDTNKHYRHDNTISVNSVSNCYLCQGLPYSFVSNLNSYYANNTNILWENPEFLTSDPPDKRYFDIGFFNAPDSTYEKTLLVLNKRCVPVQGGYGDLRSIKLYFNSSSLSGFNNWVLYDPLTNERVTFDKSKISNGVYFPHVFQPGEGRLLKIAPVMKVGGTFVCDEVVEGKIFNCYGSVFNGGYSLDLSHSTISFAEDVQLSFINSGYLSITGLTVLKGMTGGRWNGIYASNIDGLALESSQIRDINSGWAIQTHDCESFALLNGQINLNPTGMTGALIINNTNTNYSATIYNSTFYSDNAVYTVAILHSAAGSSIDYLDNNSITTNGNSSSGIFMTNECSLNFFNNNISGFAYGVNIIGCTGSNIWNNTINATRDNSRGIVASGTSILNLTNLGELQVGGLNRISNYGDGCVNILVDNSSFTSDYGHNQFNVVNSDGNFNYDGTGNFIGSSYNYYSRYNCFNGTGGTIRHDLRTPKGQLYTIYASPYDCSGSSNEDVLFTIPIAENVSDTIYKAHDSLYANLPVNIGLYKNIVINAIKREYDSVKIKGHYYLNTYIDSVYSPDIIAKLYHASVSLDSIGEVVQPLKNYLEQLIINNPNNSKLITSAYYHVQKCKVYLEQYQSALAGFEDIIAQNPYGYEGLLASWDYAATLLLMDTIGAGGMSNKTELAEYLNESNTADFLVDTLRTKRLTKYDNYDKSVFTTNDRKIIILNTAAIFSDNRNKQVEKVKELEKKINNSKGEDVTKNKTELATMKALNEVVKTKRAKDQPDYLRIITEDVNKVFKNPNEGSDRYKVQSIPKTFELYQNYPNPFNPSTKIAFDLPQDGKVKLAIYDILGRQIKTLVDNELRTTGKYTIEFNGSHLASGVYFYRLQVEGGKTYTAVKKMVMIK